LALEGSGYRNDDPVNTKPSAGRYDACFAPFGLVWMTIVFQSAKAVCCIVVGVEYFLHAKNMSERNAKAPWKSKIGE